MPQKKKRSVIIGGYGYGNVGDEAILSGLMKKNGHFYDEITVFSRNPEETTSLHGVRAEKKNFRRFLSCDEVIIGGGELFQDGMAWKNAFAVFLAKSMKKKVRVLGVGIDVNGWFEKTMTRYSLRAADEISVRDRRSAENLISMGIQPEKIKTVKDFAFCLEPRQTGSMNAFYSDHGLAGSGFIILVLRHKDQDTDNRLLTFFTGFLVNQLQERQDLKIILMPFGRHPDAPNDNDVILLQKLKSAIKSDRLIFFDGPFEPSGILWLISKASLVISARLHPLIFSTIVNTNGIALPLFSKARSHAEAYDQYIIELKNLNVLYDVVHDIRG